MARKKSTLMIDTEIEKTISNMTKLQDKYDALAERLEELRKQKREIETKEIMEAYARSNKSFEELMTFLKP